MKNAELTATIAGLTEKVAKLTKNSSNSQPSSKIISPPKSPDKRKKRKQNAQTETEKNSHVVKVSDKTTRRSGSNAAVSSMSDRQIRQKEEKPQ